MLPPISGIETEEGGLPVTKLPSIREDLQGFTELSFTWCRNPTTLDPFGRKFDPLVQIGC
jgi:hypothetical protein